MEGSAQSTCIQQNSNGIASISSESTSFTELLSGSGQRSGDNIAGQSGTAAEQYPAYSTYGGPDPTYLDGFIAHVGNGQIPNVCFCKLLID